jgi:hypothetical protein
LALFFSINPIVNDLINPIVNDLNELHSPVLRATIAGVVEKEGV